MNDAIKWAGGKLALAKALGVTHAAVSHWLRDGGLPPARAIEMERLTGGALRAVNLVADIDRQEVIRAEK